MILFEYAFIYFKHYHEKDRLILSAARGSLQVIFLIMDVSPLIPNILIRMILFMTSPS